MFPPETMQTTLPVPALPASAAAVGERAGALGDHPGALGDQRMAAAASSSGTGERAVDQRRGVLPDGRDQRAAAGAVDERAA